MYMPHAELAHACLPEQYGTTGLLLSEESRNTSGPVQYLFGPICFSDLLANPPDDRITICSASDT